MILVPTGNDEMDRRINGIPHPSIIMMEGDHGTGEDDRRRSARVRIPQCRHEGSLCDD